MGLLHDIFLELKMTFSSVHDQNRSFDQNNFVDCLVSTHNIWTRMFANANLKLVFFSWHG